LGVVFALSGFLRVVMVGFGEAELLFNLFAEVLSPSEYNRVSCQPVVGNSYSSAPTRWWELIQ